MLKLIKQEKCDRSGAFIVPNETAFIEIEPAVLFDAIGHLIEQGILKKRLVLQLTMNGMTKKNLKNFWKIMKK